MKKYLVLLLLFLPIMSYGAPSVRMLGNQPALSAAVSSGAKVTPVKSSASNTGSSSAARVGSLSAKAKVSNLASGNNTSSASRFPVIQPAYSYSSVSAPQTSGSSGSSYVPSNVDVNEIVNAVMQNVEHNYYDKGNVYNNNEFVNAVENVVSNREDDPRFDAVRVRTAAQGSPRSYWESQGVSLPSDYVYIWIEENN